MASSGQTFSPEALRHFRIDYFLRHWGTKVVYQIYYCSFIHAQPMNIIELLKHKGISLEDNPCLSHQEIENISKKPPEDLDITTMYKICTILWRHNVNYPGSKLRCLVIKIKEERNNICHEVLHFSGSQLKSKVDYLQTLFSNTIDEAKSRFRHHGSKFDQLKSEIKDATLKLSDKIRERLDPTSQRDMQILQDEIKNFWDELYEFVKKLSRKELKSQYSKHSKITPIPWIAQYEVTDSCNITVPLKMVLQKVFHDGGKEGFTVDQNHILEIKDLMGEDPKVIIISGDAGAGKTTILSSIVEKWQKDSEDMPNLSSFEILLYMQFRNDRYENFDDYLKNLFPKTLPFFYLNHIKPSILRSKCLILCDGYDEFNNKSKRLFNDILSLDCDGIKIVVTTRPVNTDNLTKLVNNEKYNRINLSVLGLESQDKKSLISNLTTYLIKDDETKREDMKNEVFQAIEEMDHAVETLLNTPLYFNMFILLYIKCPKLKEKITSLTTFCIELRKQNLKFIIDKIGIEKELLDEFDNFYRDWCLRCYKENKFELSETHIKKFKSAIQNPEVLQKFDAIISCYFNVKHNENGPDTFKVFCYRHRSELEFTVASMVSDKIIKSGGNKKGNVIENAMVSLKLSADKKQGLNPYAHRRDMLRFFRGLLYNHDKIGLYEVINDIHGSLLPPNGDSNVDYFLEPCFETGFEPRVFGSLVSVLKSAYKGPHLKATDPRSLLALPKLMRNVKFSHADIEYNWKNRQSQSFLETLNEMDQLEQCNESTVSLKISLRDIQNINQFSIKNSFPRYMLNLYIYDELEDVGNIGTFPILSRIFIMTYNTRRTNIREISQMINKVWPRILADSSTEAEGNSKFSSPTKNRRKLDKDQVREVIINFKNPEWTPLEHEMRILLQSLTIQPLTQSIISSGTNIMNKKGLENLCRKKGLGELVLRKIKIKL